VSNGEKRPVEECYLKTDTRPQVFYPAFWHFKLMEWFLYIKQHQGGKGLISRESATFLRVMEYVDLL